MGKILLTHKNVGDYISEDEKYIYIDKTMIFTPGAKDLIRNRGIMVVYGEKPQIEETYSKPFNMETLKENIETILREDYNITDKLSVDQVCSLMLEEVNTK